MTRLKRLALGGAAAALIVTGAASASFAEEPGDFTNVLRGASEGLPLGAAPPPGLYSGLETATLVETPFYGNQGAPGLKIHANVFIGAVPIVWSTGWNVFGANLILDAVQAFYTAGVYSGTGSPATWTALAIAPEVANTTFDASLSWKLGQGWFLGAGFSLIGPDGTQWTGGPNPDYWSYQPHAALSYLANNWVLSANFTYDINSASRGVCCGLAGTTAGNGYLTGQELYGDFTAVYKFGKWEFGPVGYIEYQTTGDRPGGGVACTYGLGGLCGDTREYAAGALIGYDFGPVDAQVWVTDAFYCHDAGGCGVTVWSRLGFKIWGPDTPAPRPLVAKN